MDRVLFCGGDRREVIAALALAQQEFRVSAFGIPEELLSKAVRIVKEPAEALCDTDICILPQPPVGRDGRLISLLPETVFLRKNELAGLRHGTPVICGAASPYLRDSDPHGVTDRSICGGNDPDI